MVRQNRSKAGSRRRIFANGAQLERHAANGTLAAANRWEVVQKGSQESAFVTLGSVGSRLLYEIAVYEFKIGREKPLIIAVRSHRGLFSAFSGICQ